MGQHGGGRDRVLPRQSRCRLSHHPLRRVELFRRGIQLHPLSGQQTAPRR